MGGMRNIALEFVLSIKQELGCGRAVKGDKTKRRGSGYDVHDDWSAWHLFSNVLTGVDMHFVYKFTHEVSASTIIHGFMECHFHCHHILYKIVSDQITHFIPEEMQQWYYS